MGLTLKEVLQSRRELIEDLTSALDCQNCEDVRNIYYKTEDELIQNVACGRALERYIKEKLNHEVDLKVLVKMIDEEVRKIMPKGDDEDELG